MKIVVTGASGFIGGHLARSLAIDGHTVFAMNRSDLPKYKNIHHIQCDLSEFVPKIDSDCDVFIHCAALADFDANFASAYKGNVIVTQNAYRLAKRLNAKLFTHISSASVYAETVDKCRVPEEFPSGIYNGNSYAKTKRLAEEFLSHQSGIPVICLRPHSVYGAGDTSVMKKLLAKLRFNTLFLPLDEPKELSITHVGNIVEAVRFLMTKQPQKYYEVFNVADEEYVTSLFALSELLKAVDPTYKVVKISSTIGYGLAMGAELVGNVLNTRPLLTRDVVIQLNRHSSISIDKIKRYGFSPKYEMHQGLEDLSKWMTHFSRAQEFLTDRSIWPKIIESKIVY